MIATAAATETLLPPLLAERLSSSFAAVSVEDCCALSPTPAAVAALAGVAYKARTGKGCMIEAPMFEAMVSFLMIFLGAPTNLGWIWGNLVLGVILLGSAVFMSLDSLRERMRSGEARRASRYGTSVRVIQETNQLGNRTLIRIGQELLIPTSGSR